MPLSQALKDRAKRNKVRITYTTSFGKRKPRKNTAVTNEINTAVLKKKKTLAKKSTTKKSTAKKSTTRAQQMKQIQNLIFENRGALAAGAAGLAGAGAAYLKRDEISDMIVPTKNMVGEFFTNPETGFQGKLETVKRWGMDTREFILKGVGGLSEKVSVVRKTYIPRATPPGMGYGPLDGNPLNWMNFGRRRRR